MAGERGGNGELLFNGNILLVLQDEKFLGTYVSILNTTEHLKMVKIENFVFFFNHIFFKLETS